MKYRVRIDLSFDGEAEARSIMDFASNLADRSVSIGEGGIAEEISYAELEICRHDEGLPCTRLDRVEIRHTEVAP